MEGIKEIIETLGNRIKTPAYGSIIISALLINWKVIFYIIFANATVIEKFAYFDIHTSCWTLIFFPVILGLLFVFISPWIKYYTIRINRTPYEKFKNTQDGSQSSILLNKMRLQAERNKVLAKLEESLIDQTKRDERVEIEIKDSQKKKELKDKIESVRQTSHSTKQNKVVEKDFSDFSALSSLNISNKEKINLSKSQEKEISKLINTFNWVLNNGKYLPPVTFVISGYGKNSSETINISIDGVTADLNQHIGGSVIFIDKEAILDLANGHYTFDFATKKNKFQSLGDVTALAYLDNFFNEVSNKW